MNNAVTPTAQAGLDAIGKSMNLSRSELLERIGRGMLQLTNHPPDAPLEMLAVDNFFAIATQEEDWHDQEEREMVQRFQNLVSVLKQNLGG